MCAGSSFADATNKVCPLIIPSARKHLKSKGEYVSYLSSSVKKEYKYFWSEFYYKLCRKSCFYNILLKINI